MSIKKKKSSRLKKIVYNHLWKMKWNMIIASLCMLGFTLSELMNPWPLKIIIDYILLDKPMPQFLSFIDNLFQREIISFLFMLFFDLDAVQSEKVLLVLIVSSAIILIAFLSGTFSYFQIYSTSRIGFQLVHTLRRELFAHLQRLSLSFHNRARSGELLTKVTSDTSALKELFAEMVLNIATHLLTLIGMFVIMFILNFNLTLIVLGTFPVLSFILIYHFRKIKASAKTQRKKEGKIASQISEIMNSVLLVQAFGRESYEEEQFEMKSSQTLEENIRMARTMAAATRTVEIISAFGKWAVVFIGSIQALKGQMTPGDILIFYSYVGKMYKPVKNLVKLSMKVSKAMVSAERINEILEVEPEIQDCRSAIEANNLRGEIIFKNVSFDYGNDKDVLKDVSFAISPGQRVALVGASGAGKSTIISLILRLYDSRAGFISIDGIDIKKYQRESLRRESGIVLQDLVLFGISINENIAYGKPGATREEIEEATRQAHAHDFIMALPDGYETILGERGSTLSGGQRQRICLARAIIKRPSILILDEPTSAVDAESEVLIRDAINRLQKGKTMLIIAHHLSSIKDSDQILVLKEGEIVEHGTHDRLLNQKGYYSELSRLQEK